MGIWWLMIVLVCVASSISGADLFAVRELTRDSPERVNIPDYQDLSEPDSDLDPFNNFLKVFILRKRASKRVCLHANSLSLLCDNSIVYEAPSTGASGPGRRRRAAPDSAN